MAAQFYQITLDSETIGGGWKLYHYEPGTTTLKDVWLDRDKVATAAQPILADANGVVSFYGDGLYDLVAHTSADVLKYTWEDVYIVETPSLGIEGSPIVSAATVVLGAANEIYYHVTGTNTIQGLSGSQIFIILTFDSTPTLTDSATFQLRNRTSRQARADETVIFVNDGSGTWREVTPPIRLPNNAYLTGRNAAGTAEINLIKANASDQIELGTTVKNFSLDADPTTALQVSTKQYVDNNHPLSTQNPISNGNMEIWQRGTSFPSANAEVTADRWYYAATGTTGVVTISRSTDKPTVAQAGLLFNYSLLVDVDMADAAVAATDSAYLRYIIEGYDWRHYAQRALTFSFWVRSSKTGTHSVAFRNLGADRSFVSAYTIAAADTWEYKTIVLSASPSSGTWDYTNDIGLEIVFTLMVGSNFTTSSLDTWNADALIGATGHVNVLDNTANLFAVTGVKLELGSTATPIQYVPFEDELRRCMRYYRKSFPYDTAPAQNATVTGSLYWVSPYTGTTAVTLEVPLGIPMRTTSPTFETYNPSAANSAARNSTDAADDSTPTMNSNGERSFLMTFVPNAANTLGDQHNVHWTVDAEF